MSKPHLLRGFKYDLRIYIVVTSFDPLKAYIFQEGLVRLATQQYTTSKSSLKKRFIHLTNYSVNKKGENYVKNQTSNVTEVVPVENEEKLDQDEDNVDAAVESKWSLKQLKEEYKKMGISYNDIYSNIKDLCVKTLMAVEPAIASAARSSKYRN